MTDQKEASDCNELLALGQTLYSLNVGNAVSKWNPQKLTPVKVVKIGRKYFWVAETDVDGNILESTKVKFHLNEMTQVSDYMATRRLYTDPQEWEDEKEEARLCREIADAFEYGRNHKSLPLAALRLIAAKVRANAVFSGPPPEDEK